MVWALLVSRLLPAAAWPPSEATEASAKRVGDLCVLLKAPARRTPRASLHIPLVTGNHISGWEGARKRCPWPGWGLTRQAHTSDGNALASDGRAATLHLFMSLPLDLPLSSSSLSSSCLLLCFWKCHRPSRQISPLWSPQMGPGA